MTRQIKENMYAILSNLVNYFYHLSKSEPDIFIEQISDPDTIQRAAKQKDALKYLKTQRLLCDEPLEDLI